jgi:hypothetical protein
VHTPAEAIPHVEPELGEVRTGQTLPQPPQLLLLVLMSTQRPEHDVKPLLHEHVPPEHVALGVQDAVLAW